MARPWSERIVERDDTRARGGKAAGELALNRENTE
jgi:hypothetical protein